MRAGTTPRCDMTDPSDGLPGDGRPCRRPVTHRYLPRGWPQDRWLFRCTPHAAWLDRNACKVEELTDVGGVAR